MIDPPKAAPNLVNVKVELFGLARMETGLRDVQISVQAEAHVSDIVAALAAACPELVGKVVRDDLSSLYESYVLNLNGTAFISERSLNLGPADTLLLFSSQAGG